MVCKPKANFHDRDGGNPNGLHEGCASSPAHKGFSGCCESGAEMTFVSRTIILETDGWISIGRSSRISSAWLEAARRKKAGASRPRALLVLPRAW